MHRGLLHTQGTGKERSGTCRGGCLAGNMRILMADGSQKEIGAVQIGDAVFDGEQGAAVVTNVYSGREQFLCVIRLGGGIIKMTAEHPVLTESGFIPAMELTAGDMVQGGDAPQAVRSIQTEEYDGTVYNLALDSQSHLMVCEGVAVGDFYAG